VVLSRIILLVKRRGRTMELQPSRTINLSGLDNFTSGIIGTAIRSYMLPTVGANRFWNFKISDSARAPALTAVFA
jgi:hypothetical protein